MLDKPIDLLTIREIRLRADLTIKKAAEKCGLQNTTYYRVERGNVINPEEKTIQAIADGFEQPVEVIKKAVENSVMKRSEKIKLRFKIDEKNRRC